MITAIKSWRKKKEIKELESVLDDLSYSLIECDNPLLREGIEENISDLQDRISFLKEELEELNE